MTLHSSGLEDIKLLIQKAFGTQLPPAWGRDEKMEDLLSAELMDELPANYKNPENLIACNGDL